MLAAELKLHHQTISIIMDQHLGLEKRLARWVPHVLSAANKLARVEHGRRLLAAWAHRWSRFRSRLVTADETYVPYSPIETRESGSEWRPKGTQPAEIARLHQDRRKAMAIIFWDAEGLVHLEWFTPTRARPGLTGELYAGVIQRMHANMQKTRPDKVARGVLLLHDNAPCHKTACVERNLAEFGIKTISHPPYSPDLAPSDYYLFRVVKSKFRNSRCGSLSELDAQMREFLGAKPASFYKQGIDLLRTKCEEVQECNGEYLRG